MLNHFVGMKALVVAAVPAAVKVEDTALLDSTGGLVRASYVILYGGGPDELNDNRFTALQLPDSDAEYTFQARCVGISANSARTVAQYVMNGVVGQVPVVTGRRCGAVRLTDSALVEPDHAVKPPMWYLDMDLTFQSWRA